ncbi:FkbM family methyltransferase [Tuwongella immobilis]|uniref:Methyltransferase FkbM domain-containing protein n=1 Tax=Tuwongella immobilis TaxID=692036 RepID=A0A6C2YSM7_9BACT|nr:FkbM family methyltransferase [Tuwongella immobilis]VIP04456.1 Methyltransferase FkbM OS=Massilia sp. JS1662 GN=IA69_09535 PE=4 SV=1: Methyltransf_21 [Tuwongella immobilis]VTS06274.1 Methyltransferase FkbM OS=Massilia sp. JS1662 GN=IA69_09535 PE=4 SV=1: Methyltransf_21 [Tuwongella immobilis]
MRLSYSQQFEDILLQRIFPHANGFYIDVGANDPVHWSVTKVFSDAGWRGINVEPGAIFDRLNSNRTRDINLRCAVSSQSREMTFFEFPAAHGLSTLSREEAEEHRRRGFTFVERMVPVRTLASICEEFAPERIDFLSIDVEGHEAEVLSGADWAKYRPVCVVVESTRPCSTVPTHHLWEPILIKANYQLATFDGLNRYYIRSEDAELCEKLKTPVNVFDGAIAFHSISVPAQELVTLLLNENRRLSSERAEIAQFSQRQEELLNLQRAHIARLEPQLQEIGTLRQQLELAQQEVQSILLEREEAVETARVATVRLAAVEALVEGLRKTIDAARMREANRAA